jgi:hypothetical protein
MAQTWKIVLIVLRIVAGSILVLVGIIGLVAPGPGVLLILTGMLLLAKDVPPVRRLMCWLLDRPIVHRLEKRFPRLRDPLEHLRANLKSHPRGKHDKKVVSAPAKPAQERCDVA